mmetsp:Transcript_11011/g.25822  ORF Transcript_11011/g.25822 Transcript_11011/m.25822 type:complete len:379 (-) Transcript_11011:164-1300(-)
MATSPVSKRPLETAFRQQKLKSHRPIFTPTAVGITFLAIGVPFIILGSLVISDSDKINELSVRYDGANSDVADCKIYDSGPSTTCTVEMEVKEDLAAPVYVYYELTNFYQNHRRYVKSYDRLQLLGDTGLTDDTEKNCEPLVKAVGKTLYPCGLMANSLFNDKILVTSGQSVSYHGTAWSSDKNKFKQPDGFEFKAYDATIAPACAASGGSCSAAACASADMPPGCKGWTCPAGEEDYYNCQKGKSYLFWYPKQGSYQYLYETFPEAISPLTGVETDRFQVWMRNAALPKFRKLYAVIREDLGKGDVVTFEIKANFDVASFQGTKSLVLSTTTWFGGKNSFLGSCLVAVGAVCTAFGVGALLKHLVSPRKMADLHLLE